MDLTGDHTVEGVTGWAFDHSGGSNLADIGHDIDGIGLVRAIEAPGAQDHPNGIVGLDHVVVMTPNIDRTVAALLTMGIEPRRRRDLSRGRKPSQQVFCWAGDVILEVVGPTEAAGDGPAHIWGLALVSGDLDATVAWFGPDRCSTTAAAVQAGRRIATIHRRAIGSSTRLVVMSPHGSRGVGAP